MARFELQYIAWSSPTSLSTIHASPVGEEGPAFSIVRRGTDEHSIEVGQIIFRLYLTQLVNACTLRWTNVSDFTQEAKKLFNEWAVRECERLISIDAVQLGSPITPLQVRIDQSRYVEVFDDIDIKRCSYQRRRGRDLFCVADSPDSVALRAVGYEALARTTQRACNGCDLPDDRHLCSALVHPIVVASKTTALATKPRMVSSAMCEMGSDKFHPQMVGLCQVNGGLRCWHRSVQSSARPALQLAPLAVHEALGYLDTRWELAFGKPLVGRVGLPGLGKIAIRPNMEAEASDALSALADLFKNISIDDALLSVKDVDRTKSQPLVRIHYALKEQALPFGEDGLRIGKQSSASVKALQAVATLRNGLQHAVGQAVQQSSAAAHALGLAWPIGPLADAWPRITLAVVDALNALRGNVDEIHTLRTATAGTTNATTPPLTAAPKMLGSNSAAAASATPEATTIKHAANSSNAAPNTPAASTKRPKKPITK